MASVDGLLRKMRKLHRAVKLNLKISTQHDYESTLRTLMTIVADITATSVTKIEKEMKSLKKNNAELTRKLKKAEQELEMLRMEKSRAPVPASTGPLRQKTQDAAKFEQWAEREAAKADARAASNKRRGRSPTQQDAKKTKRGGATGVVRNGRRSRNNGRRKRDRGIGGDDNPRASKKELEETVVVF